VETIRELLGKSVALSLQKEEIYLKVGAASNVDLSDFTFTLTPNDETAVIEKVLLKAIATSTGGSMVIIPVEGSFVVVGFMSSVTGVCIHVEEAGSISMTGESVDITATDIDIDSDDIRINAIQTIFNSGTFGGLIKIVDLTAKLNELRDTVNDFIQNFRTHVHTGVTTGAGSSGTTITNPTDAVVFNKDDYEDTDITH